MRGERPFTLEANCVSVCVYNNNKKKPTDDNKSIFLFDLALIRLRFYVNNVLHHVVVHEFFNYGGSSLALHLWQLAGLHHTALQKHSRWVLMEGQHVALWTLMQHAEN